ncbi:MAG: glycosyltransferase [Deltaproteobacteria bacterium]
MNYLGEAVGLWLLVTAAMLLIPVSWCVLRFRFTPVEGDERGRSDPRLPCEVLVPVKGVFPDQERILSSLLDQSHPSYRVSFIVESEEDPANSVVDLLCARYPHSGKIVSGAAALCAQKNHNLIAGIRGLHPDTRIVVFCDSTNAADPGWLTRFTRPLEEGTAQVVTTHRAFNPAPRTSGGVAQAVYGSLITCLTSLRTTPWGGGTAILRETMEHLNLPDAWSRTLNDDLVLGNILRRAGIRIACDSRNRLTTPLPYWTWKRFATFLDRQIVNPKFTNRGIWLTTVTVMLNLAAAIVVAGFIALIAFPLGHVQWWLGVVSFGFFGLIVLFALLLRYASPFPIPVAIWCLSFFYGVFLAAFICFRSFFRNYVNWHGKRYIAGRDGVVVRISRYDPDA